MAILFFRVLSGDCPRVYGNGVIAGVAGEVTELHIQTHMPCNAVMFGSKAGKSIIRKAETLEHFGIFTAHEVDDVAVLEHPTVRTTLLLLAAAAGFLECFDDYLGI